MRLEEIIDRTLHGTSDSDKHLILLYSLVIGSGAKNIIELGVRGGDSTMPLTLAAKETGGMVYSIDISPTPLVLPEDLQKHNTFVLQDAILFLENWDKSKHIDIVFIDDWHSYPHVKKELEILSNIVTPMSVILLHDLMYYSTCPDYHSVETPTEREWEGGGPYKAVAELDTNIWEWATLPWNHGMTILRKKSGKIVNT